LAVKPPRSGERELAVPTPVWIYHITNLANLASIAREGMLYCKAMADSQGLEPVSIAYTSIQELRKAKVVPIEPHGTLHDYVPFYFCNRSPMLYAIHTGQIDGYEGGQRDVVHLVSSANEMAKARLQYVFTDGHAIMNVTRFFNDPTELRQVDWQLSEAQLWHDTDDDPDRKRRKQSEFLVHGTVPTHLIRGIGVADARVEIMVHEILRGHPEWPPQVVVRPNWYY
jgi:ssDNA thymidine ADP-ribosyltransferase, DarT